MLRPPVAGLSRPARRSPPPPRPDVKILMLGWEFPPHVSGGLGTACHGMVRALARGGADVTFVVPRGAGGPRASRSGGPRIETIGADADLRPYGGAPASASLASAPHRGRVAPYGPDLLAEVARYARAAKAVARRGGFDVVHAHDWMTYPAGIEAARVLDRPLVVHVHATEHDRSPGAPDPRIVEVEQRGVATADRVVCVSRYEAGVVARHYRVDAGKVRVVHNGVVPPRAPRGRRRRVRARPGGGTVLFLGRVTAQKGPGVFLDAAARVLCVLPRTTFVVAGSGDLLPWAIERAARLRIARRVRFTGFLRGAAVARAYAAADVFVLPSVSEPFGLAPLEAMSMGVPTIVSSASGVREVVRHALVVDPHDVDDLASKEIAILSRPRFARALGREGRAEAHRLDWGAPARRLLEVYGEAIA